MQAPWGARVDKLEGGDDGVESAAALDLCGVVAAAGAVKFETGLGIEVAEDEEALAARVIRPNEVVEGMEEWRQGARDWGVDVEEQKAPFVGAEREAEGADTTEEGGGRRHFKSRECVEVAEESGVEDGR